MVTVPTKPVTGVNTTLPVGSLENVPLPRIVMVVCTPGSLGSRSMLELSRVAPVFGVSLLAGFNVTGVLSGVVMASGVATGGNGGETVTVNAAGLLT